MTKQLLILTIFILCFSFRPIDSIDPSQMLVVVKTKDFKITGAGTSEEWKKASWVTIPVRAKKAFGYETKTKMMYSDKGMYFLYQCADKKLTASLEADFLHLWDEDVVEVFLQPDTSVTDYFEYELSPLNYELPIMIYNRDGKLNSWMPFGYEGDRKTVHATTINGGEKKSESQLKEWIAEFFIPYSLLEPVMHKHPTSGTIWRGNVYRIDYDNGQTLFSWQNTGDNYHVPKKFGYFKFE